MNGRYEIIYYGVLFEGDHDDLGFFVVKAANVNVDGNKISFDVPTRYFFTSKNAPNNLEAVNSLLKLNLSTGRSSEKMIMQGYFTGRTIELHCTNEYGGINCYSDNMTFRKELNGPGSQQRIDGVRLD